MKDKGRPLDISTISPWHLFGVVCLMGTLGIFCFNKHTQVTWHSYRLQQPHFKCHIDNLEPDKHYVLVGYTVDTASCISYLKNVSFKGSEIMGDVVNFDNNNKPSIIIILDEHD